MAINISITTEQKHSVSVTTKNQQGQVDTTSPIQVFSNPNPPLAASVVPVNQGASNRDFDIVGSTNQPGTATFTFFANGKGDQAAVNVTQADLSETTVTAVGGPVPKS